MTDQDKCTCGYSHLPPHLHRRGCPAYACNTPNCSIHYPKQGK